MKTQFDGDVALADDDLLADLLDDLALLFGREVVEVLVEGPGVLEEPARVREGDLEVVEFALETGRLFADLVPAIFERPVAVAEAVLADFTREVELHHLVHVGRNPGLLAFERRQEPDLLLGLTVGLIEMLCKGLGRHEEAAQLFLEDGFEVDGRDLVLAAGLVADVLGAVALHVHLGPAVADGEAREELSGSLSGADVLGAALGQDGVARLPKLRRNDRRNLVPHPVGLRLQFPRLLGVGRLGVVGAALALGRRVAQEADDGRVRPSAALALA